VSPRLTSLFIPLALFSSATSGAADKAKYGGEFMAIGVGGRALALGSAYVAVGGDATAAYWNPAGLSELSYPQIALMHDERFAGLVNYDYAGAAVPIDASATIAVSAIRLGVDDIPDTRMAGVDAAGNPLPPDRWEEFAGIDPSRVTWFNTADWALYLSYARASGEHFSFGGNIKVIRRENGDVSATGIGLDFGALWRADDRLSVGAHIQDVTTTLVAWNSGLNELILPTLKLGAAYRIPLFGHLLMPVADVDVRFEGRETAANLSMGGTSFDFHGGVEFEFAGTAAIRGGYTDIGSLTMGAGIDLPKLDIDYTFARFDGTEELGNTHRVSIAFTLEAGQFYRKK
jgi:hypothetical protein